jgi:hypothetical protein
MMDINDTEDAFVGSNDVANTREDAMEMNHELESMEIDDEAVTFLGF